MLCLIVLLELLFGCDVFVASHVVMSVFVPMRFGMLLVMHMRQHAHILMQRAVRKREALRQSHAQQQPS